MCILCHELDLSGNIRDKLFITEPGWYPSVLLSRLHTNSKAAADIEYPAYGVTGPNKEISPTGDRRLAQSAQMYHYQHQKQQIIAMEKFVFIAYFRT